MTNMIRVMENIFLGLVIITTIPSLIFQELTLLSVVSMISLAGWITMSGLRLIDEGKKTGGKVIISLGILLFILSFIQ